MAVLKKDLKRVTVSMPSDFLTQLNKHLKNFALTDRSSWLIDAAREKMAKEKEMLIEINDKE
jgi:metal-responsive CopG/Arc/MetJ family transcriptional regulator